MKNTALLLGFLWATLLSAQEIPENAKEVIKSLYTEALGEQQGYQWLQHLCTGIGPRPSGSEAANEAAKWAQAVSYTHLRAHET